LSNPFSKEEVIDNLLQDALKGTFKYTGPVLILEWDGYDKTKLEGVGLYIYTVLT
jgi:hypothetical protein